VELDDVVGISVPELDEEVVGATVELDDVVGIGVIELDDEVVGATVELDDVVGISVLESPLMEPELAAQFPEIKNYVVQGIDDPTATGRIDTSPKGFRAMVISASGTFFIDPYWSDSDAVSICYAKKDFVNDDKMKAWSCGVQGGGSPVAALARASLGAQRPTGATLRVYRAAIAATGEYTAFHGGTVPLALAAINTSLARVNTVY
jgi:hypothetical protein